MGPGSATRFYQVSVQPNVDGPGWQTQIVVSNEANEVLGTRDLSVSQEACTAAVDATALALALMIEPNSNAASAAFPLLAPAQPTSARSSPTSSEPVVQNVARELELSSRPPPAALPTTHGWRTRLGLGVLAGAFALPEPSLGGLGGVRLSPARSSLGIDLSVGYVGLQRTELSARSGAEFSAVLGGIGVWGALWSSGRFQISLAAGGQAWRITACGFGFTSSSSCQPSVLVNVATDAELVWGIDEHWGLFVRPGVGVPFVRDTFQVTASDGSPRDVFPPASVVGWLSLGFVVSP
ncbi:MAG TPA: hypothetical protein VJV79_25120 [Polyangiaceae bacterium]|nr:hypothetical protein [Polyangiaceae bacterium]